MFDIFKAADRKKLAKEIQTQIDNYCQQTLGDDFRTHLGASEIGHECSRYLYLKFRWFFKEETNGRQQRLFERGHLEELRFVRWFEGIGFKIQTKTEPYLLFHPESDCYLTVETEGELKAILETTDGGMCDIVNKYENHRLEAEAQGIDLTPKQLKFSACQGHFGGSCDGQGYFPEFLNIPNKIGYEFKTNGTGSSFTNLKNKGVALEKPAHDIQMNIYGFYFDWDFCVYANTCKNDDDMHIEIIPVNKNIGEAMIKKANEIIFAEKVPAKLSLNPAFHKCSFCAAKDTCHNGKLPLKNCRTCIHSKPVVMAQWRCEKYSDLHGNIPKEVQKQGCNDWQPITINESGLL
jgi:hypothetical protein